MKSRMTDSQILFCIIFSLVHGKNIYTVKKTIFNKKLILKKYINYNHSKFDDEIIFDENYKLDSIIKLINYSLFMNFGIRVDDYNFELKLFKDFRIYRLRLKPNNFNDLNLILDFWYSLTSNIYNTDGVYKKSLMYALENSKTTGTWKTSSAQSISRSKQELARINPYTELTKLGEISTYILNDIENTIGKPDWNQNPIDIIKRLKFSGSYSDSLLDLTEYIFNSTKSDPEIIFPPEIKNTKIVNQFLSSS